MDIERRMALAALIRAASDTELQFLESFKGAVPLKAVLIKARRTAVEAMAALIGADPTDTTGIMRLQNEAQRFIEMVEFARKTLTEGAEAIEDLRPEEEAELREAVLGDDDEGDDA